MSAFVSDRDRERERERESEKEREKMIEQFHFPSIFRTI